ncbi:MAG: hypothetical protein HFI08_04675 [Bacilli bacterium]|nr:hypothetical protein [Bacilli bacterium]
MFYSITVWFVAHGALWFSRGHYYDFGSSTGVFGFGNALGSINSDGSFRVFTKINYLWKVNTAFIS